MRKAFKYRLYPNKAMMQQLEWTLTRCRELYNAALTERRDAYNFHVRQHPNYYDEPTRKTLSKELTVDYYEQQNALPEIKAELREEYQEIAAHVLQDVLRRLDLPTGCATRLQQASREIGTYFRWRTGHFVSY